MLKRFRAGIAYGDFDPLRVITENGKQVKGG